MNGYRIDNNTRFGGDGQYIETNEFGVIKEEGLKERIIELVSEFMKSNEVIKSDTNYDLCDYESNNYGLNCDYELYSEMIYDIVSYSSCREISPRLIESEILEALVNEGFIKNGLIKQSYFFKNRYGDYQISNEGLQRIIKTNEVFIENNELIKLLIKSELVFKVDDTTIKLNTALTKALASLLKQLL
ncbi:MAG: hypothetical protein K2W92_02740 [Alphaproteobacteria bacterium]|nr:hypothetical protein [Alphaproteobacteria bacterium]